MKYKKMLRKDVCLRDFSAVADNRLTVSSVLSTQEVNLLCKPEALAE